MKRYDYVFVMNIFPRLWPTYASAHNNIGTLVNGVENAEQHFLQAIKYNRRHVNAHYNLGKLYK